jgi:hypothetical protein
MNIEMKIAARLCAAVFLFGLPALSASAHEKTAAEKKETQHGTAADVGKALANPIGALWNINFNNSLLTGSDGNLNQGDPELGSQTIFQPVMPLPLYGEGKDAWRLILRPVVPIIWSTPVPTGFDDFDSKSGIGDIQLPMVLSLPASMTGNWIIGAGPVFQFPTASEDELGADQYAMGPAVALGYHTPKWTAVVFPNYFWKIAARLCAAVFLFGLPALSASAHEKSEAEKKTTEHGSAAEVGKKLANPLGDLWNINFNNSLITGNDGNLNQGNPELGSQTIFQPVMPLPVYGKGKDQWRVILRPVVPIIWSTPVPTGFDEFDDKSGIGDIQLPIVLSLPASISGNWILGAGPVFQFPTASEDELGADQYAMGPAVAVGYHTPKWTAVVFPNYFWRVGSSGQGVKEDTSNGTFFYSFFYNLENAWQVGTNPTISYNDNATSGNKWNVPIGLTISKTTHIGNTPVNFKLAAEMSIVSPDDFGQQFAIRLMAIPVVKSWVQKPIFGR